MHFQGLWKRTSKNSGALAAVSVSKNIKLLFQIVLSAHNAGLPSTEDHGVGQQFPVVFAALHTQDHAYNDILNFMTSLLDLVKPMVPVGLDIGDPAPDTKPGT